MPRSRHLVTAATSCGYEADTGRFSNRYADLSPADIRPSLHGGGQQREFRQSERRHPHYLFGENTMAQATATLPRSEQVADKTPVRPFRVNVPEAELIELRRRIMATRFPEKEPSSMARAGGFVG